MCSDCSVPEGEDFIRERLGKVGFSMVHKSRKTTIIELECSILFYLISSFKK
jgi:hypothetical protein